MNRVEFMRQLERLLQSIPEAERAEALQYYNDYFDDAGMENEKEVIDALGNPAKVAENIKHDLYGDEAVQSSVKHPPMKYQETNNTKQEKEKKVEGGIFAHIGAWYEALPDWGQVLAGESQQSFTATEVRKLDAEVGTCQLNILPSEDQNIYVHTEGVGTYQGYVKDETLYLKGVSAGNIGADLSKGDNGINLDLQLSACETVCQKCAQTAYSSGIGHWQHTSCKVDEGISNMHISGMYGYVQIGCKYKYNSSKNTG